MPPPPDAIDAPPAAAPGDLTEPLIAADTWADSDVEAAGIPVRDVPFVTVGGGLGSFAMADLLRTAGLGVEQIAVLSDIRRPDETYRYLAENSQIPESERLRSDAGSVMDNIWAFPSYAMREAAGERSLAPVWQVLTEPLLAEFFTPRSGQVYRSVEREALRIGWEDMRVIGHVRMVRRRLGGGYFTVMTPPAGTAATRRVAYRSSHVHLAVGYPGLRFLADLQAYRSTYGDYQRVVNAYEPHEHVYQEALRRPCTVLVRGSGIVASRVFQRLIDDRDQSGAQTTIIHLFRNYVDGPQGEGATFRRPGGHGFAYQAFNYPKAAWGGQLRNRLAGLEGQERADLLDQMGGTNTAPRRQWRQQLLRGEREGFYEQRVGTVTSVAPSPDGSAVVTSVTSEDGQTMELSAQFIIDSTGLEARLTDHRLMADLLEHGGAGTNPKGRLDVDPTFEVRGTRSESGRMYASGSITLGGYYAGVDSFLGLQYAALQIADDLAHLGFCRHIGPGRSIAQWWRWARNRAP